MESLAVSVSLGRRNKADRLSLEPGIIGHTLKIIQNLVKLTALMVAQSAPEKSFLKPSSLATLAIPSMACR